MQKGWDISDVDGLLSDILANWQILTNFSLRENQSAMSGQKLDIIQTLLFKVWPMPDALCR